jgi:dihydrofolate reductase
MPKLRVNSFSISLDGYGAGPDQSLANPMGAGGMPLHQWAFKTQTLRKMFGQDGGSTEIDDGFAARGMANLGAWILGRNMFGPVRGSWSATEEWNGWWGDDPPYHTHVFVLTHHPRPSVVMDGGTVFHFATEGIEDALERARECAGPDRDVRVGGGVSTVRQYVEARLVDELHLAIAPVLLGSGECLLKDLDMPALGYRCVEHVGTPRACHVLLRRED